MRRSVGSFWPGLAPFFGNGHSQLAEKIFARERSGAVLQSLDGSLIDQMTAVFSGARPQIENVIGGRA